MLSQIKDIAAKQVSKVLASDATLKVIGNPQLQQALVAAINLRAEARDLVERRVKNLASTLELVTRDDVAKMRRSIRDLEDNLAEVRDQLDEAQNEINRARAAADHAEASHAAESPAAKPKAKPRRAKTAE